MTTSLDIYAALGAVAAAAALSILVAKRHKDCSDKHDRSLSQEYRKRARQAALQRQENVRKPEKPADFQKTKKKKPKVTLSPPERFAPKPPIAALPAELAVTKAKDSEQQSPEEGPQPSSFCLPVRQRRTPSRQRRTPSEEEKKAFNEALVVRDGLTNYLHIPFLPSSQHTSFVLKRLAKEFAPIMKRRGYKLCSVSEMCCCSDATKAAKGQDRNPNRIKVVTSSGNEDQCGGYNRTIRLKDNTTIHMIHIRIRDRFNHYKFKTYDTVANTMAHELAHCVHQNHSPAFYKLMTEIKQEHADLVAAGTLREGSSSEEQFGFNIYGQSVSRAKF